MSIKFDLIITIEQLESILLNINKDYNSDYFNNVIILESYIYISYINTKPIENIFIKYFDSKKQIHTLSYKFDEIKF